MSSLPNKVLWTIVIVLAFISFYSITVAEGTLLDKRQLYIDMCDFVDSVVDSREITESELRAFNTKIESYGFTVDYSIERLIRSVDPDPLNPGEYVTTWIAVDDNMHYNQGDKIVLHVWSLGNSTAQNATVGIFNFFTGSFDRQVPARIR